MIDEQRRLDEVQRYDVLDSEREAAFDHLAELAACVCATPIAFISFVDGGRVWHKAGHGAALVESPRESSLFADVIAGRLVVVEDALADGHRARYPVVTGPLGVRSWAGAPLATARGFVLGTVCVLDRRARTFSPAAQRGLLLVRDEVMRLLEDRRELIELRRAESLRQEAVEALLATKSDLEARIALRTREVESAHARIRNILERVADGFVALDRDWRYTYVNARAAAMFGRTPDQLIGKHIWTEFPDGVGQPFQLAYERAMREQVTVTLSARYSPWDRWFENRIYPSPDGITIFFTETTDKRRAEIALEDTARRLAEAQAVAHVGSWEWAVSENRVVWSEEMHRIYGTTPASFDGSYEGFLSRVHPEDVAHTRAVVEDAYREPKRFVYDHRVVRSDGAVRMLHTVGEAIADASGRVLRMVGTCWDTTGQWEAQRQLELTGALVETLLASVAEGVLAVDAGGRIIAVNDVCARMFALPPELSAVGSDATPLFAHIEERSRGARIETQSRPFALAGRRAGSVHTFRAST